MLTIVDHRRDSAGLTYIYPVLSRRAGGVSLGVNLNINRACNWACVYCQVEGLQRGGPPPLDLALLGRELDGFLLRVKENDLLSTLAPPGMRQLVDVAFSGDGEPTSAPEFADAVQTVVGILHAHALLPALCLRLITNGSLVHRPAVQQGIAVLGQVGGEVWFKLDRAIPASAARINGVPMDPVRVVQQLAGVSQLARTWVQTCWFAEEGVIPGADERAAYCDLLAQVAGKIAGVHLYGLARPSMQAGAARLGQMAADELQVFAREITARTGSEVRVSP